MYIENIQGPTLKSGIKNLVEERGRKWNEIVENFAKVK